MILFDDSRPLLARSRVALLLLAPVALTTVATVSVSTMTLAGLDPSTRSNATAGLARIGADLALVIVTDNNAGLAATRSLIVGWGIFAPLIALGVAMALAWWISGLVQQRVNAARVGAENSERDRESRLQEVVHELRTPLAVMGTNLELAGLETDAGGRSHKYIAAARRAAARMSRTVDDLAGHGRLAVGAGGGPLDLRRFAEAVVDENYGPAATRGVNLKTAGKHSVVVDVNDPTALRTAVENFMSNAIRLAPRGSAIVLDWGKVAGWAWLSVTDDGPGLPSHHHARVFERGWQGPHERDRRIGSGLGLTIARQMTEALGGLSTVESEEGGGATFAIWIPTDADADADAVVAPDRLHPAIRPWAKSAASL